MIKKCLDDGTYDHICDDLREEIYYYLGNWHMDKDGYIIYFCPYCGDKLPLTQEELDGNHS